MSSPQVFAAAIVVLIAASPRAARAYRPFDGTDADVAELHTLELEIGPIGYFRMGSVHDLVTGGVVNYGFARRFELVVQGFDFAGLDGATSTAPYKLTDTGVFVKAVLREGCLQDKSGPSVATEVGPLLPTVNGANGLGAYAGGIISTCVSRSLIVHWNVEAQILRSTYDLDLFAGAILEPPPSRHVVRPVVELFIERDFGGAQTYSGLVGAIWTVDSKLALDAAMREALIGGQNVSEIRTGFTWVIP
jgi:hypothetical protein